MTGQRLPIETRCANVKNATRELPNREPEMPSDPGPLRIRNQRYLWRRDIIYEAEQSSPFYQTVLRLVP